MALKMYHVHVSTTYNGHIHCVPLTCTNRKKKNTKRKVRNFKKICFLLLKVWSFVCLFVEAAIGP